jgi:hypothetical protein
MKLTLSVDDRVVERAREAARQQGASLNALIRQYLEALARRRSSEDLADALLDLFERHPGNSRGRKTRRGDAYDKDRR